MLDFLIVFALLALLLSIIGWVLFFLLSMDAVYREAKEQLQAVRHRLRQRHGDKKPLTVEAWTMDEMWEDTAVAMWRDGRELSAIELVQQQTGTAFEEAQVKLLKLNEENELTD